MSGVKDPEPRAEPSPPASPPEVIIRDDYAENEAFRNAMRELRRLRAEHELAAMNGSEAKAFADGYTAAVHDLAEEVIKAVQAGRGLRSGEAQPDP